MTPADPSNGNSRSIPETLFVPGNVWNDLGTDPQQRLVELANGRPIFFLETHHVPGFVPTGGWVIASADLARKVLMDPVTFSSYKITGIASALGGDLKMVPLEADPPEHAKYRAVVSPFFTPRAIKGLEDAVRSRASGLIDAIITRHECEFMRDFGRILPAAIFLDLYGLPSSDASRFLKLSEVLFVSRSPTEKQAALHEILEIIKAETAKRRTDSKPDILSAWTNASFNGKPATEEEYLGGLLLLFAAGLDTVASTMGWIFRHLATNVAEQNYLRQNRDKISTAIEEYLRYFAPANLNRRVTRDVELGGVRISKGDAVTILTVLPCRDVNEFEGANDPDISAGARRHVAFGYGIHTCIGMHLARLELRIALELWLARFGEFRLAASGPLRTYGGTTLGLEQLPITW